MRSKFFEYGLYLTLTCVFAFGATTLESARGQDRPTHAYSMEKTELKRLIQEAKEELKKAKLSNQETQLRLAIVRNVATVKAYFPHVIGGPPEYRNEKHWVENDDGFFIPNGSPSEAIKNLWVTISGVRCHKLSSLVMFKGLIDVSNRQQIAKLDAILKDRVIPSDLDDEGVGLFFDEPEPKNGETFQAGEFLAGDEVWFDNPYFDRLEPKEQSRYRGQEGHHVFYVGCGKLMDMYDRTPIDIEEFRESFLSWASVNIVANREKRQPVASDFQIKEVRRVKPGSLK